MGANTDNTADRKNMREGEGRVAGGNREAVPAGGGGAVAAASIAGDGRGGGGQPASAGVDAPEGIHPRTLEKKRRWRVEDEYETIIDKIGEGTFGVVSVAKRRSHQMNSGNGKSNRAKNSLVAIKNFKPAEETDGISFTAIREIMLLNELEHDNIVDLESVHFNYNNSTILLVFEYAEHDMYEIIKFHRENNVRIPVPVVKCFIGQLLSGLQYLHENWIFHRDLKPSNILLMNGHEGDKDKAGLIKIADFGLARIFKDPIDSLHRNGVVVTIWYRPPELLLDSRHYTHSIDLWAVGCILGELLKLRPLFQGEERKGNNVLQLSQLEKILSVLGAPTTESWPDLAYMPHYEKNTENVQDLFRKYVNNRNNLRSVLNLKHPQDQQCYDLLKRLLEFDPSKRITAKDASRHPWFKTDPLPSQRQSALRTLSYPTRIKPYLQKPQSRRRS